MLKLSGADEILGQRKARELLAQQPKVVRHTKAWVDDKELCLEVECALNGGSSILVEMLYCWDTCGGGPAPWQERPYYYYDAIEWLLNNRWLDFYHWVQVQFDRVLERHATDDYYAEFDEPSAEERAPEAEPSAAADPAGM
jgi:hypothetical protein